jgi:hypothetical protein
MGNKQSAAPFPNPPAIEKCLRVHFDTLAAHPVELPDNGTLYSIEERFGTLCNSWKGIMQPGRFGRTTETNIIYRSQIVDKLFSNVEETLLTRNTGTMVKGPQGIGKSHTLVNLVLKLQSTGNYLVTFVPDCGKFKSGHFILKVICDSYGIEVGRTAGLNRLTPTNGPTVPVQEHELEEVIDAIVKCLQIMGKKWVFVFDQINRLFASQSGAKKISHLAYPSYYIENVMREGIISIISASANNEFSYIESHVGFCDFDHSSAMSDNELKAVFGNDIDLQVVHQFAGHVPQYVKKFLAQEEKEFRKTLKHEVYFSCESMKANAHRWPDQLESMISCVLGLESVVVEYDRKYLLRALSDWCILFRATVPGSCSGLSINPVGRHYGIRSS